MKWVVASALFGASALGTAGVAMAADKPLYQPVPAWVKPAPAIVADKLGDDAPILVMLDTQERLADGTVWAYRDVATRLATPEVVAQAGTLTFDWAPAKGDLVIHRIEIIRGAQHIDVLAGGKQFTVIRREQQLERLAIDGQLTATLAVEGLQVGDILHATVTVSAREDALGGAMQEVTGIPADPLRVGFARTRLVWPAGAAIKWKTAAEGAQPKVESVGADRELLLTGVLPKTAELPDDAPARFRKLPIVELSSFADWAAVSSVMAPYYRTTGTIQPGSALASEAAAIKAAQTDPLARTEAALELVQNKVRYLFNGLDKGNYVPQSPEQTWTLRYGDCKAKTLLLLSLLDTLGVKAEPVLANAQFGDAVPERLPSAAAFNHVLVHATIGGKDYWLDGTGGGARLDAIEDVPPFRWVLPVRAAGATLLAVPARAPARPSISVQLDYDQRAGIRLPTALHLVATVRGQTAAMIGLAKTQGSKEQKEQLVYGFANKMVGESTAIAGYTLGYDPAAGVATIDATGLVTTRWQRRDGRYRLTLDKSLADLTFAPDRARAAWQAIPVATGAPDAWEVTTHVQLGPDGAGMVLDGAPTLDAPLGPLTVKRTGTLSTGLITVHELTASSGAEIAAADVPAARERVDAAKRKLLEAVAPADLPQVSAYAEAGRREGRFKPLLALYGQAIANDPDKAFGYAGRANLLQGIGDWRASLPDLDKAIALEPDGALYVQRARTELVLGDPAKARADAEAALKLEPANNGALAIATRLDAKAGHLEAALTRAQARVDAGGDDRSAMVILKADLLARAGRGSDALAALDAAIVAKPGNTQLLNGRCWLKAQLNVQLDTALKDCTKAIELSDDAAHALDSRALVYYRLNRPDDALADLDAALEQLPQQAGSLYLRGIIRRRQGQAAPAARDLGAALFEDPLIADEYQPFGIAP